MTDLLRNVRVAAPLAAVHASVYWLLNHFSLLRSRELPLTWLDRSIPFWTWTIWGYFALVLMAIVMPLAVRNRQVFRQLVVAYGISVGTVIAFFTLWPTHYPRPPVPTDPSWHNLAYYWLIQVDSPECCFPSSHIIVPVITCVALWQDGRRGWGWSLLPLGVGICTVTILTTKQHYFWDLLGGLAAAALGIAVARRLAPMPQVSAGGPG
jgi:hypothetical protein